MNNRGYTGYVNQVIQYQQVNKKLLKHGVNFVQS